MKKEELTHMLELAKSESTTEEVLTTLWFGTTSVKIRKAVASNPNASSEVLKIASRLYLEEVLENPGFQMIRMFESDPWVNRLYEAYENPDVYYTRYGKYQGMRRDTGDLYNRAILLSKKLTPAALNCCLAYGPKSALDRAIKNKSTFNSIQTLAKDSIYNQSLYSPLDLESIFTLYKSKILDKGDIMHVLSRFGFASTSASKRLYSEFFKKTIQEYFDAKSSEDKEFLVRFFAKLLMVSRSHTLNWMNYWQVRSIKGVDFIAKVLYTIINAGGKKTVLSEHRRFLCSMIITQLFSELGASEQKTKDYEKIYQFFNSYGIKDTVYEFTYLINLKAKSAIEEIRKCSTEAKEFFVRSGSIGDWCVIADSDGKNILFNEVNEYLYSKYGIGEGLLFRSCSLRKIISINDSAYIF